MFGLLLLLLIAVVVVLPIAIIFHIRSGIGYRRNLARRIDQLRLGKMLTALGIDTTQYLQDENLHEIKEQVEKCEACDNTLECDENLTNGNIRIDNIDYCNNNTAMHDIVDRNNN